MSEAGRTGSDRDERIQATMAAVAPLLTALRTAMAKTPKPDTAAASKTLAELKVGSLGRATGGWRDRGVLCSCVGRPMDEPVRVHGVWSPIGLGWDRHRVGVQFVGVARGLFKSRLADFEPGSSALLAQGWPAGWSWGAELDFSFADRDAVFQVDAGDKDGARVGPSGSRLAPYPTHQPSSQESAATHAPPEHTQPHTRAERRGGACCSVTLGD